VTEASETDSGSKGKGCGDIIRVMYSVLLFSRFAVYFYYGRPM